MYGGLPSTRPHGAVHPVRPLFFAEIRVATTAELIALVEAAIEARLAGRPVQSYSIDGRNIQYVSLQELFKVREQLQAEHGAQQRSVNYAEFTEAV